MADVTLAESHGQVWLVAGEEHIDDLLANTLPPGITIEIIPCADRTEVWALWQRSEADEENGANPWIIHPNIVRRIKGSSGQQAVRFTPWSAMMDSDAQGVLASTADWMAGDPAGRLILRQSCPAAPPPGLVDLQRLRAQLVASALAAAGTDPSRIEQESVVTADAAATEQLDLIRSVMA